MNNKIIKILIVLAVFTALTVTMKASYAYYDLADSYTDAYNKTVINYDDLKPRYGNGSNDANTNSNSGTNNSGNTNSNTTKTATKSASGDNYYSLFSFGSRTNTDNSVDSKTNTKVATSTSVKDTTTDKSISDSSRDSRYGGARDVTGRELGASVGYFTPTTFWGWLLALILILVIVILVRLVSKSKKKKEEVRFI